MPMKHESRMRIPMTLMASHGVAQISNLPYRGFSTCGASGHFMHCGIQHVPQDTILRYDRLETCVTTNARFNFGVQLQDSSSPLYG